MDGTAQVPTELWGGHEAIVTEVLPEKHVRLNSAQHEKRDRTGLYGAPSVVEHRLGATSRGENRERQNVSHRLTSELLTTAAGSGANRRPAASRVDVSRFSSRPARHTPVAISMLTGNRK